jgi:DNA-binding beta-propeller fold protein YncE
VTDPFLSTLIVVDGKTDQAIDTIPVGTPMPACFYNGTCTDLGTFPGMITLDDNLGKIYVGGNGDGILYIFDINTHHMIGEMHMGVYHHK